MAHRRTGAQWSRRADRVVVQRPARLRRDRGGGGEGGIVEASAHAYARLTAFIRDSETPCLLRTGITWMRSPGRWRRRTLSPVLRRPRARTGRFDPTTLPAATAIGRCDDARVLQIYWLAAAAPGMPVENPRQVSAYRYPRTYGPQPPSFARAMLPPTARQLPLLLSGTASVVGHASQHADALLAQVEETFANFDALLGAARQSQPALPAQFGARHATEGLRARPRRPRHRRRRVAGALRRSRAAHRAACGDLPARAMRGDRRRPFGLTDRGGVRWD